MTPTPLSQPARCTSPPSFHEMALGRLAAPCVAATSLPRRRRQPDDGRDVSVTDDGVADDVLTARPAAAGRPDILPPNHPPKSRHRGMLVWPGN